MIKYSLLPHQKVGVDYLMKHHYSLLCDAMGLGKTLEVIEVIKRSGLKTLVVCPAFLQETWLREIKKFTTLNAAVWDGKQTFSTNLILIVSYSKLKKVRHLFKQSEMIAADEVHYLKNPDAQRTDLFHEYLSSHKPQRFIGATGTPILNRIPEFYSLLALCSYNPKRTSGINVLSKFNYWQFCNYFSHRKEFNVKGRTVVRFEGYRNLPELKELLKGKYLRRKASQVLDLPKIIRKDVTINNEAIDYDLLKAYQDRGGKEFICHKVNSAKIKVPHTVKYAKNLLEQGEGPLIIFTDHVEPAQDLGKSFRGYKAHTITGATPMKLRDKIVQDFQAEKVDVLVATIGSLSVGVTLTKSRNLIFNDLSFVPANLAQAEKRIHRIGQTSSCVIHRVFWGKIDAHIGKELTKKINTISEVM